MNRDDPGIDPRERERVELSLDVRLSAAGGPPLGDLLGDVEVGGEFTNPQERNRS